MIDLNQFKDLFAYVKCVGTSQAYPFVEIEESRPESAVKKLYLTGLNSFRDWFLLKPDEERWVCVACPRYQSSRGACTSQCSQRHNRCNTCSTVRTCQCRCHAQRIRINSPLLIPDETLGHQKACDILLFGIRDAQKLSVSYIEMKSSSADGFHKQLKSMSCFVRYVASLLNVDSTDIHEKFTLIRFVPNLGKRSSSTRSATGLGSLDSPYVLPVSIDTPSFDIKELF